MRRKPKKRPAWLYLALAVLLAVLVVALLMPSQQQGPAVRNTAVIDDGRGEVAVEKGADIAFEELNEERSLQAPVEAPPPVHNGAPESGISLVMDDVGYDMHALKRVLALPFPVAISVLPDAPHASESAELAYREEHLVMLHLPMEPSTPKYRESMSTSFLRSGMDEQQIRELFADALARVPHAVGVNNHMGSLLTTQAEPMRWVMQECREHALFFIDSKTATGSVAADVAAKQGVVWGSRRIFLDHTVDAEDLKLAWNSALKCAQAQQSCIVIAHPHAETLDFLEQQVAGKDRQWIRPVTAMLHAGSES